MGKAFFIAGTDTEVGKTTITAGLLEAANQQNARTLGLKPLAAGAVQSESGWTNEDALCLQAHSSVKLPYEQINPVLLKSPVSPHIAAQEEGKQLSIDRLSGYCRGVRMQPSDLCLIEGAGGWRVPINHRETLADLAVNLQLPVILVVGLRLGCINHTLLTVEAIRRDGLPLAGWVANQLSPEMAAVEENLSYLQQHIPAPCLGRIPYLDDLQINLVADQLKSAVGFLLGK